MSKCCPPSTSFRLAAARPPGCWAAPQACSNDQHSQQRARAAATCQAARRASGVASERQGASQGGSSAAAAEKAAADDGAGGQEGEFQATFRQRWGARWPQLFASLSAPSRHVALLNSFLRPRVPAPEELPGAAPLADRQPQLAALLRAALHRSGSSSSSGSSEAALPAVQALHWEPPALEGSTAAAKRALRYPPPPADPVTRLTTHYWIDAASLVPPLLLDVAPGQAVLDMCAAPGGKSLVLAQLLLAAEHAAAAGEGEEAAAGSLVCNEKDAARRARLVQVLRSYVPLPARHRVRVTPYDGAKWWGRREAETFDRVLLDAPCSSDRHVAQQAAERGGPVTREDWSLARCRALCGEQYKLLEAAAKTLRPGGRLVYSTCSILEEENEGVVQRLLDRAAGSVTVASHTLEPPVDGPTGPEESRAAAGAALVAALEGAGAERTRHGWLLLPDAAGCGPIYCCVLHKAASCDFKRVKVNKYARDRPGSEEEERAQQVLQREQRRGRRQRRPDLELTGESEEP